MNSRFVTAALIVSATIAFVAVSFLVIITRRNSALVKRKLQIGAFLLSISGIAAGCGPTVECYAPAELNAITIDQFDWETNGIRVSLSNSNIVTGNVQERRSDKFSFTISDSSGARFQADEAIPSDGAFDEPNEDFKIMIDRSIPIGTYDLRLYSAPKDSIDKDSYYQRSYRLLIEE